MSQERLELAVKKLKQALEVSEKCMDAAIEARDVTRDAFYQGQMFAYHDALKTVEGILQDADTYKFFTD